MKNLNSSLDNWIYDLQCYFPPRTKGFTIKTNKTFLWKTPVYLTSRFQRILEAEIINCLCIFPKVGCSHCHCQQVRTICAQRIQQAGLDRFRHSPSKCPGKHKEREQWQVGHSLETQQKILPPAPPIQQVSRTWMGVRVSFSDMLGVRVLPRAWATRSVRRKDCFPWFPAVSTRKLLRSAVCLMPTTFKLYSENDVIKLG